MVVDNEVRQALVARGINVDEWGRGQSKTFGHLIHELEQCESWLNTVGDRVIRVVEGVGVNVLFDNNGVKLMLHEDKQVFADREEARSRRLSTSVGEKMKPGESPEAAAAARLFIEELGLTAVGLTNYRLEDRDIVQSTSFPGLWTKHTVHVYDAWLTPDQYNPNGYIEIQPDKTTYFAWVKL